MFDREQLDDLRRQVREPLDDIYAARLRTRFREALERAARTGPGAAAGPAAAPEATDEADIAAERPVDAEKVYRDAAIARLRRRDEFFELLRGGDGVKWGTVQRWLSEGAPKDVVGNPVGPRRGQAGPARAARAGRLGLADRDTTAPRKAWRVTNVDLAHRCGRNG